MRLSMVPHVSNSQLDADKYRIHSSSEAEALRRTVPVNPDPQSLQTINGGHNLGVLSPQRFLELVGDIELHEHGLPSVLNKGSGGRLSSCCECRFRKSIVGLSAGIPL